MDIHAIARWWVGKFNGDTAKAEMAIKVVIGVELFLLIWTHIH